MTEFLRYAAFGLGNAGIYAIAAFGIIAIYRGTATLNFAHGAIALLAAEIFVDFTEHMGWVPAAVLAIAITAAFNVVIALVVMRPLAEAAPVTRLVATLGLFALVQQVALSHWGTDPRVTPNFLPTGIITLPNGVILQKAHLALLAVAAISAVLLTLYFTRTRLGALTEAVAENPRAAAALGHSPTFVGALAWAIGGTSAAAAGILIVPVSGLTPIPLTLVILPAFAAALIGSLRSFWLAGIGALLVGCGQSLVIRYANQPGFEQALPFLLIVLILVLRTASLPERSAIQERLPRVPSGPLPVRPLVVGALVTIVVAVLATGTFADALIVSLLAGLVALSVVVLTGYAGQVSLAQYAFVGIAALVTARVGVEWGWTFPFALVAGVVSAGAVGALFGIPSARARGVSLAVVTLGLGVAISSVVFVNDKYTGDVTGTPTGHPSLFGFDIAYADHPTRYRVFLAVVFCLAVLYVAVLRRSTFGRRLLAIRGNERAASAMGIHVSIAKAQAFALSAAVAGLCGAMMTGRYASIDYTQLGLGPALNIVVVTIIMGVGFSSGGAFAGLLVPSAVVGYITTEWLGLGSTDDTLIIATSIALLLTLVMSPDGVIATVGRLAGGLGERITPRGTGYTVRPQEAVEMTDHVLEVRDLTVTFGGTTALDAVSLSLRSGEVLGVIGPNGAGKTTLIDAISGFVRSSGSVTLDGTELAGMKAARRGRAGIARTFQGVELFDDLTVAENISVAYESSTRRRFASPPGRDPRLPSSLVELADRVELTDQLGLDSDRLGPGPRRVVSVIRAVAQGQPVLLLDEPAAALDRTERIELVALIRKVAREQNLAVLLIEHDVELVTSVSDAILAIEFGKVIFHGTPDEALHSSEIRRAYLGDTAVHEPEAVQTS
ncbi:MAG: ATP-binding cassette domain-containing protein [Aeromicrobium sp.]